MPRDSRTPKSERSEEIIRAYGADPQRWPESERPELSQNDPDIEQIKAEEQKLDALLDKLPGGSPSSGLAGRVMAAAPIASRPQVGKSLAERIFNFWSWGPSWRLAAVPSVLAVVVIGIGALFYPFTDQEPLNIEIAQVGAVGNETINGMDDFETARTATSDFGRGYPDGSESDWDVGFDPAGIELTSYVVDGM